MTKVSKKQGGSFVVENGRHKKIEGTQETAVPAPRDSAGQRMDRPAPIAKPIPEKSNETAIKGAKK
ncbi:hypothetical protein [Paremcibacter congregatus]|uniref:hypothetical protein n=1 Tax=Paremcibacter congregatus TaxID=2043170 RepID=UPI0030EDA3BA|tara:strand:+ start:2234 stop:2431 length:198 start_codon:yes stop_codon:yes gene_type:complete